MDSIIIPNIQFNRRDTSFHLISYWETGVCIVAVAVAVGFQKTAAAATCYSALLRCNAFALHYAFRAVYK
jgi:hypothetical protein